jgi:DNA-binding CsgD family transcriptional regulator
MSEIKHYGMPRKSGRYPWGSGKDAYERAVTFRSHIDKLKSEGLSNTEIAAREGISTTQLRARLSLTKNEKRAGDRAEAVKLMDKGYSPTEIGRKMGRNESSIRSLLDDVLADKASVTKATADMLKAQVDEKKYIDVGSGVETHLGITRTKLNNAVNELQEQGYKVHRVNVEQIGLPGQFTIVKVLGAPETEWKTVVKDVSLIKSITSTSDDFGRNYKEIDKTIQSIDSKRLQVRFSEEGGTQKDGVMELRKGVKDLDLGTSKYAQVRIGIDGTHYLKGMAIYSDDMPKGVDIIFNTNKSSDVGKMGALKKMKTIINDAGEKVIDPDNPFGSTIKRKQGGLNIVNEEGDWDNWSKTISSQVLSKQSVPLAKKQLGISLKQKQEEYDEIVALTNPVVKKQLLDAFADDCDSSAVHLKAAALPRQASKVILPIPGMKENEVYAPTFNDGESVVLIRHPHGGTFEIPQVTVNNKHNKAAQSIMANAPDAIGIHPKVAQKLSGADFDGDAVIVIPNSRGLIKTSASLKGLENFDPVASYKIPEGSNIKPIKPTTKQTKMGEASNLITDMTIKGATLDEICRAVRHSMVVIDSEKHNLDYRQSFIDHGIASLSALYQNGKSGGASTLVSRASSQARVDDRKPRSAAEGGPINTKTGEKVFTKTGESYVKVTKEHLNAKGKLIPQSEKVIVKQLKSSKMAETNDAFKLSSGRPMEETYAAYANGLKDLANKSRLNSYNTTVVVKNPSATIAYSKEVASLNASLNLALKNKPIEREAMILATSVINRKKQNNPDMEPDDLKKLKNKSLADARVRTGAHKFNIKISDDEWRAIQAGAISPNKLSQILQNTDLARIKELATPRITTTMLPTKVARAQSMLDAGYTQSEVAESLGVSTSSLSKALKE